MSRRLASLAGLVVVGVVAAAAVPAAVADPGTSRPEADKRLAQRGPQTSDGVRGKLAPYVPRALRTPPVITNDVLTRGQSIATPGRFACTSKTPTTAA